MDACDKIIDKIRRNRVSTTEIADCMEKTGAITGVYAVNAGHFRVGRVFWAYAYNESNWELHEQVRDAQTPSVFEQGLDPDRILEHAL